MAARATVVEPLGRGSGADPLSRRCQCPARLVVDTALTGGRPGGRPRGDDDAAAAELLWSAFRGEATTGRLHLIVDCVCGAAGETDRLRKAGGPPAGRDGSR